MQETEDPRPREEGDAARGRDAEATSDETLSDIEQNEKVGGGAGGAGSSSPLETSSPDPDAGGGGRADGSDTGGPM